MLFPFPTVLIGLLLLCHDVFGENEIRFSPDDDILQSKRPAQIHWVMMPHELLQAVITATNEALDELGREPLSSWEAYRDLCRSVEDKINVNHNDNWICISGVRNQHGASLHSMASKYIRYTIDTKYQFTVFVPSDKCSEAPEEKTTTEKDEQMLQMQEEIDRLYLYNQKLEDEVQRLTENVKHADLAATSLRWGMAGVRVQRDLCEQKLQTSVKERRKLEAKGFPGSRLEKSTKCAPQLFEMHNEVKRTKRATACEEVLAVAQESNLRLRVENKLSLEALEKKNKEIQSLREDVRQCDKCQGELLNIKSAIRSVANSRTQCEDSLQVCERDKVKCQLGISGSSSPSWTIKNNPVNDKNNVPQTTA